LEIGRREFLKLLGVSTAATAAGAISASTFFSIPDHIFKRAFSGPHIESWINSICSLCPGGCGIRVRLIDGIPVRVLGNPIYPINKGAVCPMAEASIEQLFHPDRLRHPLKRAGKRGENQWQKITWEEALQTVAGRLQNLREKGSAEKFVLVSRHNNDMVTDLASRFMKFFGSPNFFNINEARLDSLPVYLSHGVKRQPAYDLAHTNFVLNFGGDFLDAGNTPIRYNQLYANLRDRKEQNRAKIIHISSYMSRTAANSSEWIPIKPGTTASLALSIAYIIIKDGKYNKEFIDTETFGCLNWNDSDGNWHKGYKDIVMEGYYPEKVSEITGISAKKIVKVARDFASAKKAVAIAGGEVSTSTNSLYTLWAIYCLNALKGNIEKPGGVLFPKKIIMKDFPEIKMEAVSKKGLEIPKINPEQTIVSNITVESLEQLSMALEKNSPYSIDTVIFHRTNPLFESTNPKLASTALQNVPFIVCCSSFIDETVAQADLILPEHTFLERHEASYNVPGVEFLHFGIQQPAIEPLYNTRNFGDIILDIAHRIGKETTKALPWDSYLDYIQDQALAIFNSGEGTIVSDSVDLSWIEFLKQRGWQAFEYSTFKEFWDLLLEKGGWWDPTYSEKDRKKIFINQSGKFEFYSQTLRKDIEKTLSSNNMSIAQLDSLCTHLKINARGDKVFLPHYEAPRFSGKETDSLHHLLSYKLLLNLNGYGGKLNLLKELFGLYSRDYWNSWLEINPQTAESLGIEHGDVSKSPLPWGTLL
jgi:anaerobic selenocysteine-containing dehydrogenase